VIWRKSKSQVFQRDYYRNSMGLLMTIRLMALADREKESTKECNYERPPPENVRTSVDEPANQLVRARSINIFPGLFSDGISSDDLGPLAHLIYASSAQPFPLPASIFSTEKFLKILPFPSFPLSFSFCSFLSLFFQLSDDVARVLITRKKGFRVPPFQHGKFFLLTPSPSLFTTYNNKESNKR